MARFKADYLTKFTTHIFVNFGSPTDEAKMIADHLVESNLMGLDSHGVIRIPEYIDRIENGILVPGGKISITEKTTTAVIDAGLNFGQVAGPKAVDWAVERAVKYGTASIVIHKCNHVGRLGAYPEVAARAGMVSFIICNATKHGHGVAPFGGTEGRMSPNPIAFGAPTSGDPIILDISTSAASEGKIRVFKNQGEQLPEPWVLDPQGQKTTDPNVFYGPPKGTILPFGGSQGYKGTGLAIMAEILSGALAGNIISDGDC